MHLEEELGAWYPMLHHVFAEPWMQRLGRRLGADKNVVPIRENWFRAFRLCSPENLKVVIIGQDPYINGEADGLSFSSYGKLTPSLEVVFEEINRTHECKRTQTHLDDWAEQGVLLLNSVLTTRLGKSKAHHEWGWEVFVWGLLRIIYEKLDQPMVFMLWGKDAQDVIKNFTAKKGTYRNYPWKILKAHHPQAQNYNPANKFVGCNHFIDANLFLLQHNRAPIWWSDPQYVDPANGDAKEHYNNYFNQLLKQIPDVKADLVEKLRSYTPVSGKPHPFDDGLRSQHTENLPF
jgi:uracil-DNA glycosylase